MTHLKQNKTKNPKHYQKENLRLSHYILHHLTVLLKCDHELGFNQINLDSHITQ